MERQQCHGAPYGDFTPIDVNGDRPPLLRSCRTRATTEIWEIVNLTADAHPIHLHLVQFQLINRQNFDIKKYLAAYAAAFPAAARPVDGYGPPLDYNVGEPADGAKSAATRTSRPTSREPPSRRPPTRRAGRTR